MLRATSSLPVPLSPCTSTGLSLAATRVIMASTSRISALSPTIVGQPVPAVMTSLSAEFSRRSAFFSAALATTSRSSAFLHGLANEVVGAEPHRLHGRLDVGVGR